VQAAEASGLLAGSERAGVARRGGGGGQAACLKGWIAWWMTVIGCTALLTVALFFLFFNQQLASRQQQATMHQRATEPQSDTNVVVAYVTTPNSDVAKGIASNLLKHKLVACCNILPAVRSMYFWDGEVKDDPEELMLIKTHKSLAKKVSDAIVRLHPYEVPEVIFAPIVEGHPAYLSWVADETHDKTAHMDQVDEAIRTMPHLGEDGKELPEVDALSTEKPHVDLKSNGMVVVKMKSNPTTGYTWEVSESADCVSVVKQGFMRPSSKLMGASGVQEYVIKAAKPGDCAYTFSDVKHLGNGQKEVGKTARVTFTVEG